MINRKITTKDTVEAVNADDVVDLAERRLTLKRQAFIEAFLDNGVSIADAARLHPSAK